MDIEDIRDAYPELLVMDGYDSCIIGVVEGAGMETRILYSTEKVINSLMADGMNSEEALEFHLFNQAGAYMGEHTPCFLQDYF